MSDIDAIKAALRELDGSTAAAVSLLSGFTLEQLQELGGFDE